MTGASACARAARWTWTWSTGPSARTCSRRWRSRDAAAVAEDLADRVGEDVRAGELSDQVRGPVHERNGVRDQDARQRRGCQRLEGFTGEDPVGGGGVDALGPLVEHRLRGGAERAARID